MMANRDDALGLRHARDGRLLPLLVAAMAFLAGLALAGATGAAALARHWQEGAAAAVTVQVPAPAAPLPHTGGGPAQTRLEHVLAVLRATPGVADASALTAEDLAALLRPWLGGAEGDIALPLPAVVQVHLGLLPPDLAAVRATLAAEVPGTVVEGHGVWVQRLAVLARSLQACAWLALGLVGLVAGAMVMAGVRSDLLARRESIEIVHGLGATDFYIASRFAMRATRQAGLGGLLGALAALPVLLALLLLAAPFLGLPAVALPPPTQAGVRAFAETMRTAGQLLPPALLGGLATLPFAAALLGLLTAQATVRRWLRHLP